MCNSFFNSVCIKEGTCRLILAWNLSLYTASSHVRVLYVFFHFYVFSVMLIDTFCDFMMLSFFDYITALATKTSLKSNKNWNSTCFSWDFLASIFGTHTILWSRNRIRTLKIEIIHRKHIKKYICIFLLLALFLHKC